MEYATHWGRIREGDYVRDANGKAWRVEAVDVDRGFLLIDRESNRVITKPWLGKDVTQLVPTYEEALSTVEQLLGGTIIAEMYPRRPASCLKRLPPMISEWQNHLFYMHGIYAKSGRGSKSLPYLKDMHDEDHGLGAIHSHGFVPHLHDLDHPTQRKIP